MALGADQLVAVGPLGILNLVVHDLAVQYGQQIAHAQRAADVAEATGLQLLEERDADFRSELFQFTLFDCVQLGTPPLLFGRGADPVVAAAFDRFFS